MASAVTENKEAVIMVIEPDVIVRTEIADFLRRCGYKVIEGATAGDVWTIIAAEIPVSVVFSEIHLPGETDGFALSRRLRQTHPGIDIVLASGVGGAAEKCTELCKDGPLKKPYRAEDVRARIHLLLERRRSANREPV